MATIPASRELALPFRIDATGGFASVTTPNDQVATHLRLLIGTELGERLMRPNYGTAALQYLFDDTSQAELTIARNNITTAIARWLPDVTVQSFDVAINQSTVVMTLNYSTTRADTQTVSLTVPFTAQ